MKKFISLILALTCMIIPFGVFAEGEPDSPTEDVMWFAEPEIPYQLIYDLDEFNEYLALIGTYYDLEGFNEMVLGTDDYFLVDMIIVTLNRTYTKVIWHTPYGFARNTNVSVFMISTDLMNGYVMNARGDKNENLVVNYKGISTGTYFMIIYVAP